jgi:enamine deaminase RidA (YjgF/YER057c/UK114 family)
MRQNISSGSPWEDKVGFSRAVRLGNIIVSAGTVATDETGRTPFPDDAYRQTLFILERIEKALIPCGATRADVVQTRMYLTREEDVEAVSRAHQEFFGSVRPAATMLFVAGLVKPEFLVEVEVMAVLAPSD